MEDKEMVKSNNILLAKFLGLETSKRTSNGWEDCQFSFRVGWDSLMLVVSKIEILEGGKFTVTISVNTCTIWNWLNNVEICNYADSPSKLESTYNACVKFVKWHNSQNKN